MADLISDELNEIGRRLAATIGLDHFLDLHFNLVILKAPNALVHVGHKFPVLLRRGLAVEDQLKPFDTREMILRRTAALVG